MNITTNYLRIERIKSCTQCGTAFSCYTSNCWCNELPNIMAPDPAKDCMCPSCLTKTVDDKFKERGLTR